MPGMATVQRLLATDGPSAALARLYGGGPSAVATQRARYRQLVAEFARLFPAQREVELFSAPGRTEVGGNHTDHNGGRVLAAAVDLDAIAAVAPNDDGVIRLHSAGYPPSTVHLTSLDPVAAERYTSAALIRGVAARLQALGFRVGGFDACLTSNVLHGSGLSSSASFEVLVVTILNHLYNQGRIEPVLAAQIAQYAENNYFGKPCGLMDQTASAVGGFVTIDFQDQSRPIVRQVDFDLAASGYTLVIVDTGGSHADLHEDYAAVEREMKEVARALGGRVLRDISREQLLESLPDLRTRLSDRAILRALHFLADDRRVVEQVEALERSDLPRFLELVIESGRSSWMLLQNCYSCQAVEEQGIPIALTLSESVLRGRGAWRVHGGGFAGTIQAFVPAELRAEYLQRLRGALGQESCHELRVRPVGAARVAIE